EKFSFYPNPVADDLIHVKIALNKAQNLTLILQDLSGKKIATIYKGKVEGRSFSKEIDLPDGLKAGLYVIAMVSESEVISRRIIIR
ncbi:MAG: T9SS type A sorting domain-containing protein, partial [Marinoscillum sp.]